MRIGVGVQHTLPSNLLKHEYRYVTPETIEFFKELIINNYEFFGRSNDGVPDAVKIVDGLMIIFYELVKEEKGLEDLSQAVSSVNQEEVQLFAKDVISILNGMNLCFRMENEVYNSPVQFIF